MSLVSLLSLKAPTIAGLELDAVFEDTFEAEVETSTYVIEAGANVSDHRVVLPRRWSCVGCISNTPLGLELTDFSGLLTNALPDSAGAALLPAAFEVSAGFLSGSEPSRAASALESYLELLVADRVFTVAAGDITLNNMTINKIRRVKTPEDENGIILELDLQELPTLAVIQLNNADPQQSQLRDGDPSKSQASSSVDRGAQVAGPTTADQNRQLGGFLA